MTRRNVAELAHPKVQQVVVNMDKLEEELAPHTEGVDIAPVPFSWLNDGARYLGVCLKAISISRTGRVT